MKRIACIMMLLLSLSAGEVFAADAYTLDPDHTEIGFTIKHLTIATIRGAFPDLTGEFTLDEKGRPQSFKADLAVNSLTTRVAKRDEHLKSPDFFDAAKYPAMTFVSTVCKPLPDGAFLIAGKLTIRDRSKEINLRAELTKPITDPWGNQRIGISATGRIVRSDFGITWNKPMANGAMMIDDEVRLFIEGEAILKKPQAGSATP